MQFRNQSLIELQNDEWSFATAHAHGLNLAHGLNRGLWEFFQLKNHFNGLTQFRNQSLMELHNDQWSIVTAHSPRFKPSPRFEPWAMRILSIKKPF